MGATTAGLFGRNCNMSHCMPAQRCVKISHLASRQGFLCEIRNQQIISGFFFLYRISYRKFCYGYKLPFTILKKLLIASSTERFFRANSGRRCFLLATQGARCELSMSRNISKVCIRYLARFLSMCADFEFENPDITLIGTWTFVPSTLTF